MKTYNILVADDELQARKLISLYLGKTGISTKVLEAKDGYEALRMMDQENVDLLFLDIKMPGLTGMDVLHILERTHLPAVIFTTAFEEFAHSAFDLDAVDYLVKPFDEKRFLQALNKAIRYIDYFKANENIEKLRSLSIKNGARTTILRLEDIEYFLADGPFVKVFTKQKQYLLSMPMYELQNSLPTDIFLRVHRSCIVNTTAIKEISSLLNGDYSLRLNNGKELRASRTYREQLRDFFGKI
jgi:two-component system LytT family response regulator